MKTLFHLFVWTWTTLGLGCASLPVPTDTTQQGVYTAPWSMVTLEAGDATHKGADGLATLTWNGKPSLATGWEQSGDISFQPVDGSSPTTLTGFSGVEDVKGCDLDEDGLDDAVVAESGAAKLSVVYGGTATRVVIPASASHGRWIQVDCADVNGDGHKDIIAGSYAGTPTAPAVIAVFLGTGSRGVYSYEFVTYVGWAMSVEWYAGVLLVTDRAGYKLPGDTVPRYDLMGVRLEARDVTGIWRTTQLLAAPYTGDQMMGSWVDMNADGIKDIVTVRSHASQPNYVDIWTGPSYTRTTVTDANALNGHVQDCDGFDVNHDETTDLVCFAWEANICCDETHSGGWWLNGAASWEREEITGGLGTKFDNVFILNGHLYETEQLDPPAGGSGNYGLGIVEFQDPF